MPDVSALKGLWTRSLITWPNGMQDTTTRVTWLQGLSLYIDLRRPAGLPDFTHLRCRADLTAADCAALAMQEGFAGVFSRDGEWFEWARAIDFQPKSLYSDIGSLRWNGDVLIEEGRDVAYIEHWHRDSLALDHPVAGFSLLDVESGTRGALVWVGQTFMIARDRSMTLPAHQTLAQCVADTGTVEEARALVDCDISLGSVENGRFRIIESTLPYRVGDLVAPQLEGETLTTCDRDANGRLFERRWAPVVREGEEPALEQDTLIPPGFRGEPQ